MTSFVQRVWRLQRAPGAPVRVWRDWMLVGVFTAIALIEGVARWSTPWIWPTVALEVALIATLLWRRTHPGLVVVIAFGSTTLLDLLRLLAGVPAADLASSAFVLILLYALARWASGRELLLGGALVVVGLVRPFAFTAASVGDVIGGVAVVSFPLILGAIVRYRDAVRTERLQQVRVLERERLARDLHDTVAHHVTAMALRAQAGLAAAEGDPTAAVAALNAVQLEASETLREMRSLVGVLRAEASLAPSPTAADLRGLAAQVRVDGDLDSLAAPLMGAVFRIAQEGVTNARRHAVEATAIEVHVVVQPRAVHVLVHDDGHTPAHPVAGFGIRGMVERADLLGGTCTAGPDPAGGWTVEATLPIGAA